MQLFTSTLAHGGIASTGENKTERKSPSTLMPRCRMELLAITTHVIIARMHQTCLLSMPYTMNETLTKAFVRPLCAIFLIWTLTS